MNGVKWLLAGVLLTLTLFGGYCFFTRKELVKEEGKLETVFTVDTTVYAIDTLNTDVVLKADSAKPSTVKAVKKERKSANKVMATRTKQVENLQKQLKGGWLKVFVEGNYAFPEKGQALADGTSTARLGLDFRLRQGTYLRGFYDQPIFGDSGVRSSFNVGLRQEFRIR